MIMKNKPPNEVSERRLHAIRVLDALRLSIKDMPVPLSVAIAQQYHDDPYLLLISCLLSLRAKDSTTLPIAQQLFKRAHTPQQMVKLSQHALEKLIYSIGFYKQKARIIRSVSQTLLERFDGKVPHTQHELLSINGIGYKTANLILGMAYHEPAICVDVHVHRLANALGFVHTTTPRETELALQRVLPKKYWIEVNHLLVTLGQNLAILAPELPADIVCRLLSLVPKRVIKAIKCKTPKLA